MRNKLPALLLLAFSVIAAPSYAALEDTIQHNNIIYFLYSAPNKIVRYDTKQKEFIEDINLAKVPTAFSVDDDFIYVGSHREISAISIADGSTQFIRNSSNDISAISSSALQIHYKDGSTLVSVAKINHNETSDFNLWYSGVEFVSSTVQNALYSRSSGISPSDIRKISLDEQGIPLNSTDSPYHGDYPSASKLYLNTSENKVYDNAGISYFTADLTYAGSLPVEVTEMTFIGDNPVVLSGSHLYLFNAANIEQGSLAIEDNAFFIASSEQNVFTFSEESDALSVNIHDVSSFALAEPGEPIDPASITYIPEAWANDGSDIIYMLDNDSLSIFLMSTENNEYKTSYALQNPATWMTFSQPHQRLYLGYSSGKITYFDVSTVSPTEVHFTTLASSVLGLAAAGDFLFAADSSGAWNTHYTFNKEGEILDSVDWRHVADEYVWNSLTQRIYHFRNGTSPNDIEWTEINVDTGKFGDDGDSPYHGDTIKVAAPLVNSFDNQLLLNGGGQLLDVYSLEVLNSLSNNVSDAAWFENQLISVNKNNGYLQFWSDNFQLLNERKVEGAKVEKIFDLNNHLITVTRASSGYQFSRYNMADLPDSDNDGHHDLVDSCPVDANIDQLDSDGDSIGDACDTDNDNDAIPDEIETSVGLDPFDNSDAMSDSDGDGFSNLLEYLYETKIDDANSSPTKLRTLSESFENEWPKGFFVSADSQQPWSLEYVIEINSTALTTSNPVNTQGASELNFIANFEAGKFVFDYKIQGDYSHNADFNVYIDDEQVSLSTRWLNNDWRQYSFDVPTGEHKITFKITTNNVYSWVSLNRFFINNAYFGKDADNDGVLDSMDNCPNRSNSQQGDRDDDSIGDYCDSEPDIADVDTDGDGISDSIDNCPEISNEDQDNLDGDEQGNICDTDIDNDGLTNDIENSYSFLDPEDASDALADQDNDGASNVYEILNGKDPKVTNSYQSFNMFDYFPLGEITQEYSDGITTYTINMKNGSKNDTFVVESNYTSPVLLEVTADCINLTTLPESEENFPSLTTENWCELPNKISEGQTILYESVMYYTDNFNGAIYQSFKFKRRIEIQNFGSKEWQGKSYNFVTLKHSYEIYDNDTDQLYDTGSDYMTLLEGIGEESLDSGINLVSFEAKNIDTTWTTTESNNNDGNGSGNSENNSSGGSTSSLGIAFLFFLCLLRQVRSGVIIQKTYLYLERIELEIDRAIIVFQDIIHSVTPRKQ